MDLYSTQSAIWVSKFNLKRFFYNQYTFSLKEFTTGCRFEAYNWLDDYAWCLNVVAYIKPVTVDLIAKTQLEDCSKVLINTIDDFSNWENLDALILETCGLSSASDVTVWTYSPILVDYEYYILGKSEYQMRFCWPGKSPFYSFFDQYPSNPVWAIYKMIFALDQFTDFKAYTASAGSAYAMYTKVIVDTLSEGINMHQKAMDGHKVQRNITVEEMNQQINNN